MQTRRFHGATVGQAYERVRAALGDDALIVTTESSLREDGGRLIEVVAALADDDPQARPTIENDVAAHDLVRALAESAAAAPRAASVDAPFEAVATPPVNDRLWTESLEAAPSTVTPELAAAIAAAAEAGERELLGSIADRLRSVEESLQRMAYQRANALVEEGPAALQDLRQRLMDRGVGARVQVTLIERLASAVRPSSTPREVVRAAQRALATLLPRVPRLDAGLGRGPLVIFVVGPAGAGKSALAIKLARQHTEARGGGVLLASTDVGRAGVPQQFLASASTAAVEARLCYTPGELRALLRDESPAVVVVDTSSAAANRRAEMLELTTFSQVAPRRTVLLALPAWMHTSDTLQATAQFAPLGLAGLVATHADHATSFGGILTAAIETSTGVAYATSSEAAGEGLTEGDNHALAVAVLTGAWPRVAAAAAEGVASGSRR